MINTEDFIKRLELILEYYTLSASGFADKIGVQRSSLSHLLSGRNKPSLDFILKIIAVFPEVDLYWILNGSGNFPKTDSDKSIRQEAEKLDVAPLTPISENKIQENLFANFENELLNSEDLRKIVPQEKSPLISQSDQIEKIVIFYSNGKFAEYNPK
jgi:transcriptional regulator with XRE-family HTH domain